MPIKNVGMFALSLPRLIIFKLKTQAMDGIEDAFQPTKPREGSEDPYLGSKLTQVKGDIISWALAMPSAGLRDLFCKWF